MSHLRLRSSIAQDAHSSCLFAVAARCSRRRGMAVEKQANPATAPKAEEDALVGRTIGGRYRIVGTVGLGGIGRVYDAVQSPLDRHVAIHDLLGGHAHDAALRRPSMLQAAFT